MELVLILIILWVSVYNHFELKVTQEKISYLEWMLENKIQ